MQLTSTYCTYTDNCPKEENDHRNYFMISLHKSYVEGPGLELTTPESAVRHANSCYIGLVGDC